MKNYFNPRSLFSLLFLCLYTTIQLSAQDLTIADGTVMQKKSSYEAIVVTLSPDTKAVKEAWEEYMEDNFKFKIKGSGFLTNKDILYAKNVKLQKVSSKNLNLYNKIVEENGATRMSVFVSFGYDIYLNRTDYPTEYKALKKLVISFLNHYLVNHYKENLENKEEIVADVLATKTNLKEDIEKNNQDIEKLTKENKDFEKLLQETDQKLVNAKDTKTQSASKLDTIKRLINQYKAGL